MNPRYEQLAVKILKHLNQYWNVGVTSPAKEISVKEIITAHLAPTDAALLAAEEALSYPVGMIPEHRKLVEEALTQIRALNK